MKSEAYSLDFNEEPSKSKFYRNPKFWIIIIIVLLALVVIVSTAVLLIKKGFEKNNATHIHYTRISTTVFNGKYEMYRLTILTDRNPQAQYHLMADFLRRSLFNESSYEPHLPHCPIVLAMTTVDHPEDWRAMLFATMKYPRVTMPHPYICFISVLPEDRKSRLASRLLHQYLNDMKKRTNPPVHQIELHANWENCRAQKLYQRCGFRCNEFTKDGYSVHEPQYRYGHMIRMELNLDNVVQWENVCFNQSAVEISSTDELNYQNACRKTFPSNLNQTCL